jgi:hypothetical protein
MVIRYGYLWLHEHAPGQEEGKDRPAAVLLVLQDQGPQPVVTAAKVLRRIKIEAKIPRKSPLMQSRICFPWIRFNERQKMPRK